MYQRACFEYSPILTRRLEFVTDSAIAAELKLEMDKLNLKADLSEPRFELRAPLAPKLAIQTLLSSLGSQPHSFKTAGEVQEEHMDNNGSSGKELLGSELPKHSASKPRLQSLASNWDLPPSSNNIIDQSNTPGSRLPCRPSSDTEDVHSTLVNLLVPSYPPNPETPGWGMSPPPSGDTEHVHSSPVDPLSFSHFTKSKSPG
ncbi:hypothetical protein M501DRAFT_992663 [Patellaria atrata CBS 101060]|uniref:Uncharacterized protein n=1 Tax=Patellaria atrata CBS 101060 TaxID=1346257 RepID=A0A9P4VSM5_9PEZI|nr:hypothetical protein M501DRAFT_992663 [Patellaria atrata CBS 101060]